MVTSQRVDESMRRIRRAVRWAVTGLAIYSAIYFLTVGRVLPDPGPVAQRYMTRLQGQDWPRVAMMHRTAAEGSAAIEQWKRLSRTFGPARSVRLDRTFNLHVPLMTRARYGYKVEAPRGTYDVDLTLQPRLGEWRVREARAHFEPPMPFTNPGFGSPPPPAQAPSHP